jgi:hypothetical protein
VPEPTRRSAGAELSGCQEVVKALKPLGRRIRAAALIARFPGGAGQHRVLDHSSDATVGADEHLG